VFFARRVGLLFALWVSALIAAILLTARHAEADPGLSPA